METERTFCQSCGMPMEGSPFGKNADGTDNPDYCSYCYEDGRYTFEGDMEGMIALCAPMMAQSMPGMTEEKTAGMMRAFFPTLKRWAAE